MGGGKVRPCRCSLHRHSPGIPSSLSLVGLALLAACVRRRLLLGWLRLVTVLGKLDRLDIAQSTG